jgi:hypothetical protein
MLQHSSQFGITEIGKMSVNNMKFLPASDKLFQFGKSNGPLYTIKFKFFTFAAFWSGTLYA